MRVAVYDGTYTLQGFIGDYSSCSVTWQWLGVGSGTLVLALDHPMAGRFLEANTKVIPVVVDVAGRRWSGRAVNVQRERGKDNDGTVTVTLIDDWAWLRALLALPVPTAPLTAQTSTYDTRTGPIATVACQYIQAAATRLGLPLVTVPPAVDTSSTVTINARMQPVSEYITEPLQAAGWSLAVAVWLPGDDQPAGHTLTGPTIVVRPYLVDVKPWLRWSDSVGGVISDTVAVKHPSAYRQVLGGKGEETARVFAAYTDTALQASLGAFGFPEAFADETQAETTAALVAQGPKHQAKSAGTVAVSIEVEDGLPWVFGEHYNEGDVPTIELSGVEYQERITRVTATDNAEDGLTFKPQVGDTSLTDGTDQFAIRTVAAIAAQLRAIQTGR